MSKDAISLSKTFPVPPSRIYDDWLNSDGHTQMTGGEATIEPEVGSTFSAWDGYISGSITELEENKRIVLNWRTTEFQTDWEDSVFEVTLQKTEGGTEVTFKHSNLMPGDGQKYSDGWQEFYFAPMEEYYKQK